MNNRFQAPKLMAIALLIALMTLAACGNTGVTQTPVATAKTSTETTRIGSGSLTPTKTPESTQPTIQPTPSVQVTPSIHIGAYRGNLTNNTKGVNDKFSLNLTTLYHGVVAFSGYATITNLNGSGAFVGFYSKARGIIAFLITPPSSEGSGSGLLFTGSIVGNKVQENDANNKYAASNGQGGTWSLDLSTFSGKVHNNDFGDGGISLNVKDYSTSTVDGALIDGVLGDWTPDTLFGKGSFIGTIKESQLDITVASNDMFAIINLKGTVTDQSNFEEGTFTLDQENDPKHQEGNWSATPVQS